MTNEANAVTTFGPFAMNTTTHRVIGAGGVTVPLTRFEFLILAALVAAQGKSVSRADLEDVIYADREERPESNGLQVMVRRIRRKLGDDAAIVTMRGSGYSIRADWFNQQQVA